MLTGTDGSYWAAQELSSVFKHSLLNRCLSQFGGMTGSRDKRVVLPGRVRRRGPVRERRGSIRWRSP